MQEIVEILFGGIIALAVMFTLELLSYAVTGADTRLFVFIRSVLKVDQKKERDDEDLPGPIGLPYFGSMLALGSLPHERLATYIPKYGDMFKLKAGCRRFVVISSIERLEEIAKLFPVQLCGKPRTFTTDQLSVGAHNDLLQRWKRRRAYMNAGLKYLERYSVPDIVNNEVSNIIEFLFECSNSVTARAGR